MAALGAHPGRIIAAIGPCIRQDSYEVAGDLRGSVLDQNPEDERFFLPGRPERWMFDLAGYCEARLVAAGVAKVIIAEGDTAAEPDRFFSHRRRTLAGGGAIGHQMSAIVLGARL